MKSLKQYLITTVVGLLAVGAIVWSKDLFAQTAPVEVFHILCDAFFAVGVVIFAAGVLVFSSNEGTFDIFLCLRRKLVCGHFPQEESEEV